MDKPRSKSKGTLAKIGRSLIIILIVAASIYCVPYAALQIRDGGGHCFRCFKTHVVHDYEAKAGLDNRDSIWTPEDLIKLKGEPLSIVERNDDGFITKEYVYEGFSVFYDVWEGRDKRTYITYIKFTVYDPEIKFSRTVHVGSTRAEIIEAYKNVIKVKEDALGEGYFDKTYKDHNSQRYAIFTYDESDIVTSITYIENLFSRF